MRDDYQWAQITRHRVSPLWMALLLLHNQAVLSRSRSLSLSESTWQRESLWMKDAIRDNVLLCFIGCSESFWTCILKINPPKAFLFLATHKDQRWLPFILKTFAFVKKTNVTTQTQNKRHIEIQLRTFILNPQCTCGKRHVPLLCLNVNLSLKLEQWQRKLMVGLLSFDNLQSTIIIQSHLNTNWMG